MKKNENSVVTDWSDIKTMDVILTSYCLPSLAEKSQLDELCPGDTVQCLQQFWLILQFSVQFCICAGLRPCYLWCVCVWNVACGNALFVVDVSMVYLV